MLAETSGGASQALRLKLLLRLAKIYMQDGDYVEARRVTEEILLLDTTNRQAQAIHSALQRAPSQPEVDKEVVNRRLVSLPLYRPAPRDVMEL